MSTTLEIVFAHPHAEHRIGDTADLPAGDARRLIRAGVARPAPTPSSPRSTSRSSSTKKKKSSTDAEATPAAELDDQAAHDLPAGEVDDPDPSS